MAAIHRNDVRMFSIADRAMPNTTFQRAAGPLFPRDPTRDDVRQGELADCGLLAILAGIVTTEPWFIQSMLRDVGDGSVLVRFFDVAVQPDATWTFTPSLVRVEKTTIVRDKQDVFAKGNLDKAGALWVAIIEKAYVAAGYLGTTIELTNKLHMGNAEGVDLEFVYGEVRGQRPTTELLAGLKPPPGARKTAKYSPEAKQWFDRITAAIAARKVVVIESEDTIATTPGTQGMSGGEQQAVARVLVQRHRVDGHRPRRLRGCRPRQPAVRSRPAPDRRLFQWRRPERAATAVRRARDVNEN